MAERIAVTTPEGDYDIVIEAGAVMRLGTTYPDYRLGGVAAVITDTVVAPLWGQRVTDMLPNGRLIIMPEGELHKTLGTVSELYSALVEVGIDRSGTIIALGGGVVGDTAGFAAATYMRGIRLAQIPTSLLAMVDSSVGGKVGVDLPQGKNLVGAFKQPAFVLIDPEVLATLPERQMACGFAEIIKHGVIADGDLLQRVHDHLRSTSARIERMRSPQTYFYALERIIRQAVQVKVSIVQADPYEHGVRAHLNLGHTFGHAIERVTEYAWLHGEAVGVGLVAAARLSRRLGLCGDALPQLVESVVEDAGLPTRIGRLDPEAIYAAMATDKKWLHGRSRFVLLREIGTPTVIEDVPAGDVISVLTSLRA